MATAQNDSKNVQPRKYFVDSARVFSSSGIVEAQGRPLSIVLDASSVVVSDQPVMISGKSADQIRVETIKDGKRIKAIQIMCPCGREARMDVKYEA